MNFNIEPNDNIVNSVIDISMDAGAAILEVYHTDFDIIVKDDSSPVTEADKRADLIIKNGLQALTPDIPILSEEGIDIPFKKRVKWNKKRPLLNLNKKKDVIEKLYIERKSIYKLAKYKINCNNLAKEAITKKIIYFYENNKAEY